MEPVTQQPAPGGLTYGEPAGRWVLAAAVLGSAVAFLDMTVVNVALPTIGEDLGAGVAGLTWIVNAYTLTLAAFVLVGGSLGDRYGRRRVFLVGAAWFGAASLACAVATDIWMLIVFRALQGVGAALLTPGSLAILQTTFRPEDRSRAIGAWSGLAGIAGAVGPFLGGWLVELASWRWIFLINVPVVLVVLAIASRHVPESRDPAEVAPLDLPGAVLAAGSLGALTYGLSLSAEQGFGSLQVQLGLALGVLALGGFVVREQTTRHPMLPLGLFRIPRFGLTNLVTFLVYAALGGVFFWLVVTLQVVAGWGPLQAGLALLPVTVLMLLFSPRAGRFGDRVGPRVPLTMGPLVAAAGVALLSRVGADATYLLDVLLPVVLLGAGLTITVTPLTSTVLAAVEGRSGLASGVNNAVARTAGLVSIAVLPTLTGLGPGGFGDAEALAPAFGTAMLVCAGGLALGGLVAAVTIRAEVPAATGEAAATCPQRHCAVDGPPVAVEPDRAAMHGEAA
jgi:EmrB/QacA subfamily drug resistance transporter